MYTTKTGINVPEETDQYKGPRQLLEVIQQACKVIDQLAGEIEKLKRGVTVYASEDTTTDGEWT